MERMRTKKERTSLFRRGLGVTGVLLALSAAGCGAAGDSDPEPQTTSIQSVDTIEPTAPQTSDAPTTPPENESAELSPDAPWTMDFSTMPDGPIDTSVWRYELDPAVPSWNDEQQVYTNSERNVRIENGTLVIEAHRETASYPGSSETKPFTSARIDTLNSFAMSRGKLVARMKLPIGQGVWPAFWLLSANQPFTIGATDEQWAQERFYMNDGEVDVVEAYGRNEIEASLHTFLQSYEGGLAVPDLSTEFHDYGVEITNDAVKWTLDGHEYFRVDKPAGGHEAWPFMANGQGEQNELYPILNLAISGTGGGEIGPNLDDARMEVEYLKFVPAA